MLSKLPEWLINCHIVVLWKEQQSEFLPFKDFVEFVGKEANIACDPYELRTTRPLPTRPTQNLAHANSAQVYKTARPKLIRQLGPYISGSTYKLNAHV